jgi:DNA-binding IclR family transcriptional regulator
MPHEERSDLLTTVERSFEIVEWLSDVGGATVTETASELDLPKSTAYVHLSTLDRVGYLTKEDGVYSPSFRFLAVAGRRRRALSLYRVAKPRLQKLARETGEVVDLATVEDGQRVLLYKVEGEDAVSDDSVIGNYACLHCSALGKAMLAYLSRERVDEIIDQHGLPARTEESITDRDALYEELDAIRERGFTYNDEEWEPGIRAVAAPITDTDGTPVGSVSITGPKNQLKGEYYREDLPERLLRYVNIIEIKLAHA